MIPLDHHDGSTKAWTRAGRLRRVCPPDVPPARRLPLHARQHPPRCLRHEGIRTGVAELIDHDGHAFRDFVRRVSGEVFRQGFRVELLRDLRVRFAYRSASSYTRSGSDTAVFIPIVLPGRVRVPAENSAECRRMRTPDSRNRANEVNPGRLPPAARARRIGRPRVDPAACAGSIALLSYVALAKSDRFALIALRNSILELDSSRLNRAVSLPLSVDLDPAVISHPGARAVVESGCAVGLHGHSTHGKRDVRARSRKP